MPRSAALLLTCLVIAFTCQCLVAQPANTQPPKLTPEQEEKLKQREEVSQEAAKLLNEGKLNEFRTKMEKYLAITREVFGETHSEVVEVLNVLINLCMQLEDFPAAKDNAQKALAALKKSNGDKHWKTRDAELKVAEVDERSKLTKKQLTDLNEAGRFEVQMYQYHNAGRFAQAVVAGEKALAQLKAILGGKSTRSADYANNLALLYQSQGMLAKAEPLFQDVLAARKELLGQNHPFYASSLNSVGTMYYYRSSFADAESLFKEALAIFKETVGAKDDLYTNCLNSLIIVYLKQGMLPKAEPYIKEAFAAQEQIAKDKPLDHAAWLKNLAALYEAQDLFASAEPLLVKAQSIIKEVTGPRSPEMAAHLNDMGSRYISQSMYAKADPLLRESLVIYKELVGDKHPRYAACLLNLAMSYRKQGLYARAESHYSEVLNIYKELRAARTYEYAACSTSLGQMYLEEGFLARAENHFNEALAVCKSVLGERHPNYATILQNLAEVYDAQRQFEKSEPLYRQAKAIFEEVVGEKHPQYLSSLIKLALMYERSGQLSDAQILYLEAMTVRKEVLGVKHPDYARSLNSLAVLYTKQNSLPRAEPLFVEALAIEKEVLGEKHPDYVACLGNLAHLYVSQRKFDKAEPLFQQALAIRKQTSGDKNTSYAVSLDDLAYSLMSQGLAAKAAPLEKQALAAIEDQLEQTAASQSESGHFTSAAKARSILNNYLAHGDTSPSAAFAVALRWSGAVNARQAFARVALRIDPKSQKLLDELRNISLQISNLVNNPPRAASGVDVLKSLKELDEKREVVEKQLADLSKEFARYREYCRPTPSDIQKLLPADAVLIDFIAYGDKVAAFIVSARAIARVDLMVGQELAKLVEEFRQLSSLQRFHPTLKDDDEALYKKVWEPLVPHLKGANLILICPDGPLCRLPFAALRATDPKKYLIEEVAMAVAPVPNMLPEMLTNQPEASTAPPSLLAMGDVDFDGDPGAGKLPGEVIPSSPMRSGGSMAWKPLNGTAKEIESIEKLFLRDVPKGVVVSLTKEKATEAAVRREMQKNRYLHFATHGLFSPGRHSPAPNPMELTTIGENVRSPEANPWLTSGIVCAGANKATPDDDGVLTALEIMNMNLSGVELAVLSVNDGVSGLQKAFQLAGVRTTITSLWRTPDAATSALMSHFYENRFRKKLSTVESLREAQLWVLNSGVKAGILTEEPKNGGRTPPIYWAAFTLAGDWR